MSKGLRSDKMRSPWGEIEYVEKTGVRGVTFVSTPSHGGYRVTIKRAKEMHPALFGLGIDYGSRYYWFEEDCDWVAVELTWPTVGQSRVDNRSVPTSVIRASAMKSLRQWQPETYKAVLKFSGGVFGFIG